MSRDKIKIGRYSKKRKRYNESLIYGDEISRKINLPNSPSFSITEDVLTQCRISLSQLKNINWHEEISNLDNMIDEINQMNEIEFFSIQDYMDIVSVTGIEPDNRKTFINLSEELLRVALRYLVSFVQCLPGTENLSKAELIALTVPALNYMVLIYTANRSLSVSETGTLTMCLNGKQMQLNFACIEKLSPETGEDLRVESYKRMMNLQITQEEAMLIVAYTVLKPSQRYPQLKAGQDQVTIAIHEYLKKTYGKSYLDRLRSIIEFINESNQLDRLSKQSHSKCPEYVKYVYQTPQLKGGLNDDNFEANLEAFSKLSL
ncbi:unnamed protein product [Dimorphilus gyrociliatus]|uniref:Uncharacterized protein n=1 Tax=Dimorphilus gyrociliatus TaxID=2664684 RepID=A0A7I8W1I8_9ANNE|nr:unnamed protein product [Dimorphilus gyrociliatus]